MSDRIVFFNNFAEMECSHFRSDYSINNGYGCAHPAQEEIEIVAIPAIGGDFDGDGIDEPGPKCLEIEGKCFSFSCPLGYSMYPSESPEDARRMRQAGLNPEHCSDDTWMLLIDWTVPTTIRDI